MIVVVPGRFGICGLWDDDVCTGQNGVSARWEKYEWVLALYYWCPPFSMVVIFVHMHLHTYVPSLDSALTRCAVLVGLARPPLSINRPMILYAAGKPAVDPGASMPIMGECLGGC